MSEHAPTQMRKVNYSKGLSAARLLVLFSMISDKNRRSWVPSAALLGLSSFRIQKYWSSQNPPRIIIEYFCFR